MQGSKERAIYSCGCSWSRTSEPLRMLGGVNATVELVSSDGELDHCSLVMLCHMNVTSWEFTRKACRLEDVSE